MNAGAYKGGYLGEGLQGAGDGASRPPHRPAALRGEEQAGLRGVEEEGGGGQALFRLVCLLEWGGRMCVYGGAGERVKLGHRICGHNVR